LDVDEDTFLRECVLWRTWWTDPTLAAQRETTPENLTDSLKVTSEALYPNIRKCLALLMVVPVSTATAERSFSTMRRVKSYLRSTMTTERLSGLGLLNIYQEKKLDAERIVDIFAAKKERRLALIFKV
jgi:histone deacetylase complex regulatory component SIN3